MNFYITNSAAPEALEFDVNQSNNVYKFIFGTQCNIKDGAQWDVWGNASGNWIHTGIPCTLPPHTPGTISHGSSSAPHTQVIYVSLTYDGVTHYVNRTYPARRNNVSEINVAFQMDGDNKQTAYSAWLDKVSLNLLVNRVTRSKIPRDIKLSRVFYLLPGAFAVRRRGLLAPNTPALAEE